MLAMEQILLDQFDNNSIIKLELANKQVDDNNNSIIKHKRDSTNGIISQGQFVSDNNFLFARFGEAKKVIKALLGFCPNLWQIKDMFNIKKGQDMVIIVGTKSGKNLLF